MTRLKICGQTDPHAARACLEAGANLVGVVLVGGGHRQIDLGSAERILARIGDPSRLVAVCQGGGPQLVAAVISRLGPVLLQVSGAAEVAAARAGGAQVIEAFPVSGPADLRRASRSDADLALLDGPRPGSGVAFDWALIGSSWSGPPFGIGGGVGTQNIAMARSLGPTLIDVSSGAEFAPGHKDLGRVRALSSALRSGG